MRYGTYLARLSLAIEEGAKGTVVSFITDLHTLVPEVLCVALIGYIIQHAGYLTAFYFVKYLSPKLEIVPLLIDGVRIPAKHIQTFFNVLYHVGRLKRG